ncbi:uncharacterized protein LOC131426022 isoform X2 [Malaya genurostris]|uniref:uncharacterized protein LOC131426022 isoform X2 n=1 Tax=Malaya genurostris TaxID=325434 RepID=UPI0026F3D7C5|nr:uncharacterized protein LOC131426022 isoform X2 [Malaya genurostris]
MDYPTAEEEVRTMSETVAAASIDAETGSCSSSSAVTLKAEPYDGGPKTTGGGDGCWGNGRTAAGPARLGHLLKGPAAELVQDELKRASTSLPPLFYDGKSDLCTLGSRPGMECVPLRSPADPYHYHHVTDQTKSLQELQNEVGALLEFRDLVIETFPDLKTKMASSAANSTLTGIPSSSLASRREWEPGIRTRRKVTPKDASADIQQHSSSLTTRSRSNSHSGKKEPKSGEGNNGSVIQDSGFSTETSSSKETHSASSTSGGVQGTIVSNTTNRLTVDTEDELWNLLDVIHRKSNRLREEVDALQQLEREKCRTNQLNNNNHTNIVGSTSSGSSNSSSNLINTHHSSSSSRDGGNLPHHAHQPPGVPSVHSGITASGSLAKTFQNQLLVDAVNKDDVQILRKERDRLFDKLSEYEAEAIANRIRTSKMQDEVDALASAKHELEDQLKAALSQKLELNTKIHDLHQQFVNKSAPSSPESINNRHPLTAGLRKHSTDSTTTIIAIPHLSSSSPSSSGASVPGQHLLKARFNQSSFAPVKSVSSTKISVPAIVHDDPGQDTTSPTATTPSSASSDETTNNTSSARLVSNQSGGAVAALGKLDGLISSPARLSKVRMTDSKKIAAILLETNIVELQRHLLTVTVQNQVLQQRLDHATRSRIFLSKKLDKSKEDIDDLKFRLEEKTIELEGTKAQLRVLESKQNGKSSGYSPEHSQHHHHQHATNAGTIGRGSTVTVVTTSAGGIVSHQHRSASTSELGQQLSPVHQHHHHLHHQQQQRDLALRLQQAQVSTPSMKAMTPLAMDEILHHSSSTESAQDQAERDSASRLQCPETPRRRPSKIPLPGTKGYVAPKPPTGRNFSSSQQQQQQHSRQEKSTPSPSGSLTNKSLNKSTGSLYVKSTGPSSITSASKVNKDASLNRPDSAQSWRRETSLEKSRSSSIPVSKGSSSGGSPVIKQSPQPVVSSSPQPKAKRDSLTTRVKNLDSLSRLQTASASTGNLSKSSSKKDLSSSFTTGQLRDRKQSASAIRRVSSVSIGRGGLSVEPNNNGSSSSAAIGSNDSSGNASNSTGTTDSGKARRTKTFRLAKPTLIPPLEVTSETTTTTTTTTKTAAASVKKNPPRLSNASTGNKLNKNSVLPLIPPISPAEPIPIRKSDPATVPALIITSSSATTGTRSNSPPPAYSSSSTESSAESSPSSVTTITTIESHSSVGPTPRGLIGEYLAAKSRNQQIPPPIFSPTVTSTSTTTANDEQQKQLALAYKHPILLMDDDENGYGSVLSSVGNERNREVEVKLVEDNSIELVDASNEGEKESLIVPKPKRNAFHSSPPKEGCPPKGGVEIDDGNCRLVGKVNPNILKTWEQLKGGGICEHKRKNSRNSLITVTSSENSGGDKQSCLIFYHNQYNVYEKPSDFTVTRIQHDIGPAMVPEDLGSTIDQRSVSTATLSMVTSSTTTETSSEGCYDFYDSIDAGGGGSSSNNSNRAAVVVMDDIEEDGDEYAMMAAGEGLADFASLDRNKLMWSIDVE